jgi:WD40 repeat protein
MIELSLVINKRKRWIQDLKFSPNGQYLAVSSHDSVIDFFKVSGNKLISYWSMNKHTAFVTHIDWSCDSSYIHSNCANYEILYSNVEGKFMDTKGRTSCRDMEWQTWTCIIGWDCEGIFRTDQKGRGWDGSDINKTDRSNTKFNGDSSQGKLLIYNCLMLGIEPYRILATADDFSKLRLYRYPCIFVNSGYLQADGHSSHVTNVKWSKKDTFVYSTGGED